MNFVILVFFPNIFEKLKMVRKTILLQINIHNIFYKYAVKKYFFFKNRKNSLALSNVMLETTGPASETRFLPKNTSDH